MNNHKCPNCGNEQLLLLRTLHMAICTDCDITITVDDDVSHINWLKRKKMGHHNKIDIEKFSKKCDELIADNIEIEEARTEAFRMMGSIYQ